MKTLLTTAAIFLTLVVAADRSFAQQTFTVDDFSDRYNAKVYISNTDEVFSEGWIAVFDKRTKKQLIKVEAEELSFTLREGKLASNIKELPYGEQSLLMYEDYNFDGVKDLALMDGQNSCYHGPSYQVYLATKTGFRQSPAFTRLAQEYCGMFSVDEKAKKIRTMTKSGCCWHQTSEFVVQNNVLVATKILEEGMGPNGLAWDYVEKNRIGGKMVEKTYSLFNAQDLEPKVIFSFELRNKDKLRLIAQDGMLSYVFTDKDDKVELVFVESFEYLKNDNTLRFANGRTIYKIKPDGISTVHAGRSIDTPAAAETRKGTLEQFQTATFENVAVK